MNDLRGNGQLKGHKHRCQSSDVCVKDVCQTRGQIFVFPGRVEPPRVTPSKLGRNFAAVLTVDESVNPRASQSPPNTTALRQF
jgi:hypothetical protein